MNTKPRIAFIAAFSLFLFPLAAAHAATFLPASDEVTSLRGESRGDVYAANNSVVIAAPVAGDIFAVGNTIDISGSSEASIFAAGRTLSITGAVQDDLRAAGSIVSIGSNIAHDLFAAGSSVIITKDSHVHGDAYVAGETVTISGTVHGNVKSAANKVIVTSTAVIMGDITAHGNAPVIEEGATVSGKITTIAPRESSNTQQERFPLRILITSILSAGVLALLLLFAAPVLVARSKDIIMKNPVLAGLTGLVLLVLCMPVVLLLLISTIGVYAGLLIMALVIPLCFLAFGLMVIATGSLLYKTMAKQEGNIWYHAGIGALVVSLVSFLGFIGFILLLLAFLVAFGAVARALWNMVQGK